MPLDPPFSISVPHGLALMDKDRFVELFTAVQASIPNEGERRIVGLRYGFPDGEHHTLAEIGSHLGVSRERIRQLLNKAHSKLTARGKRQIRAGRLQDPLAELMTNVQSAVRPDEPVVVERMIDFADSVLPFLPTETHALPLVATPSFRGQHAGKPHLAAARQSVRRRRSERARRVRLDTQLQNLLSDIIWPQQVRLVANTAYAASRRAREVSITSTGTTGFFHSEKLDREVHYESAMERDFLLGLEELDQVIYYQEQPLYLQYSVGSQSHAYYPDVLFALRDGRGIIAEIKPIFQMALEENLQKWRALRRYCVRRGLGLLVTDGRRSIQSVQRHTVDPGFERAVLLALADGPISWNEYRPIKETLQPKRDDFVALVFRHRLVWRLRPFLLSFETQPQQGPTAGHNLPNQVQP